MQKGSIVVCINDSFTASNISMFNRMPIKGELYIVREIMHVGDNDKTPGVTLEEIYGKVIFFRCNGVSGYMEFHFVSERFEEVLPPIDLQFLFSEKSAISS